MIKILVERGYDPVRTIETYTEEQICLLIEAM